MNSRFKFPRRVRIHGGECGAVARALHHEAQEDALMSYEWAFLRQADLGKAPGSTIERKQMSTKTTLKRIALVAVSALGFGVLTSVAPASAAANDNITKIAAGTPAPARVGVLSGATTITLTHASSASSLGTDTVTAQITSAPATSANAVLTFSNSTSAPAVSVANTSSSKTDQLAASNAGVAMAIVDQRLSKTTTGIVLSLNADVAGTYSILVTADAASAAGFSAGKLSTTYTITTAGAPTALTATAVAGAVTTGGQYGQVFALTMKDANGNATVLGLNEAIDIADDSADTTLKNGITSAGSTITSLGSGSTNVSGTYYVRAVASGASAPAAAGTAVLTFTGGGVLPATLTVNTTVTLTKATAATGTPVAGCTTTANCTASSGAAWSSGDFYTTGAQSLTFTGLTSGSTIAAAATAATKIATTAPAVSATDVANPTVTILTTLTGGGVTATVRYGAPVAYAISVLPSTTVLSATAGTTKWTVEITDQYGSEMAYQSVSVAVSGRNTVTSTALGVTDADGLLTYSLTDKGTSGTSDTLTFTGAGTTATGKVTYGTVTVSTVTVTGGSTVADTGLVAGTTKTLISAVDNGPEASAKAIKAVVKDANGNLLAGVPVTFSVSSGLVKKTASVDYSTVYTGADGSATSYVFDWKTGTQTITATAGGVSKTDYLTWANETPASARVLSGTVTGNIVSYKVVDRFGNPVNGATISLSRTGSGLFGNGASTQSLTTDKTGTADASFTGDATVVAELAATTQGYDAAGKIGTTAVTAATAGTTAGTGDTLAPAGVGKVELKVALGVDASTTAANAAADAAAEAIDAANAATDAANLAAEAADAATVAAEEARDAADAATAAVEELATQVATLMAALKAQITTLANTVAKIAKKVKA
jgi:hypothetical protein